MSKCQKTVTLEYRKIPIGRYSVKNQCKIYDKNKVRKFCQITIKYSFDFFCQIEHKEIKRFEVITEVN